MAKFVFVTGGVVSSLGKGITAASLGTLLKARGYKVTMQKMDPYLNVDPGTMSPFQHGEVFVTDDGLESDLDLGHYERFIDENLTHDSNVTQGSIYQSLIARERRGDFLGGTVQVIPHVTNAIKDRIRSLADSTQADIVITEIGGTVGDIESQPFIEAVRQWRGEQGAKNVCFVHVTLVPYIAAAHELKTKPTQHSASSRTSSCSEATTRSAPSYARRSRCSAMSNSTTSSRARTPRASTRFRARSSTRALTSKCSIASGSSNAMPT